MQIVFLVRYSVNPVKVIMVGPFVFTNENVVLEFSELSTF